MTGEVVEKLIGLEQKLTDRKFTFIKQSTVEFEKCHEKAENIQAEQQRFISYLT